MRIAGKKALPGTSRRCIFSNLTAVHYAMGTADGQVIKNLGHSPSWTLYYELFAFVSFFAHSSFPNVRTAAKILPAYLYLPRRSGHPGKFHISQGAVWLQNWPPLPSRRLSLRSAVTSLPKPDPNAARPYCPCQLTRPAAVRPATRSTKLVTQRPIPRRRPGS